jgi:hypothetical protein
MARNLPRIIVLGLMLMGGLFGLKVYDEHSSDTKIRKLSEQVEAEKQKNELLRNLVTRIETDKRVAQVIVTDQRVVDGKTETTLLFSEYKRGTSSELLPSKRFVLEGTGAHIDAYVIQFEGKYVEANDPLRGHGVALFKRVFGDNQAPTGGYVLDSPGEVPEVYKDKDLDPKQAELEQGLWKDFWRLADDPAYRAQWGVKLAYGGSVFREEFKKGFVYTITLSPVGGLKLESEKMNPLMQRALEEKSTRAY